MFSFGVGGSKLFHHSLPNLVDMRCSTSKLSSRNIGLLDRIRLWRNTTHKPGRSNVFDCLERRGVAITPSSTDTSAKDVPMEFYGIIVCHGSCV